ncbi:glycosyltransferase [Salinisphaera sp. SPP-AMP-43]|uniref:glycosyltransferase family 2 protein n=1 Tax=Salinisphaera sp. SPP-AMP-43 TaxID=3121288 RepID=UPI003C6DE005
MTQTTKSSGPHASDPTVSVVISTHNRANYLAETFESLFAQTHPVTEIIVVNDASTDETADVLARFSDRITVVNLATNQGKAGALNTIIPEARGEFLWIFDDDDVALPDALARHLALIRAHPDTDFTFSSAYHTSDPESIWNRSAWHANTLADIPPEAFLIETLRSMNTPMQGMLISRQAVLDIGMFDTDMFRCQDLDLLIRLGAKYRGRQLDSPSFVYREHARARGGGQKTHSAKDRFQISDRYRKQVFRKLRNILPLDSYLQHLPADHGLFPAAARDPAALIQRATVFMRQGLVSDALVDFDHAFGDPNARSIDTGWIADNLSTATDVEPWMFESRRAVVQGLANVLARHGQHALARAVVRGLFWSMRRELQGRRSRQAGTAGLMLVGFAASYVPYRLRSRAS